MKENKIKIYILILSVICVLFFSFFLNFGLRINEDSRILGFPTEWLEVDNYGNWRFIWLGLLFNIAFYYSIFRLTRITFTNLKNFKINKDLIQKNVIQLVEIISVLLLGLLSTKYFLQPIYESKGILFQGNVWVNWFGVSYILFFFYRLAIALYIPKKNILFKKQLTSVFFGVCFIGAIYILLIPFVKGINPF